MSYHRTKLGLQIDWGLVLFFLLLAGACVARGQEAPKPVTICGMDHRTPAANLQLIQASCIDFDRLRALAPGYPWPVGRVTQVLIHARAGDRVYVSVDGGKTYRRQQMVRDAEGRYIALLQYEGAEYSSVDVDVVPESKE